MPTSTLYSRQLFGGRKKNTATTTIRGGRSSRNRKAVLRPKVVAGTTAIIILLFLNAQLRLAQLSGDSSSSSLLSFLEATPSSPFPPSRLPPDAYFNNVPVRLRDVVVEQQQEGPPSFHSSVHCVGETHDPSTAWKHRSCNYVHLCLDLGQSKHESGQQQQQQQQQHPEFFLVTSKADKEYQNRFRHSMMGNLRYSSTEIQKTSPSSSSIDVALGGINPMWKAKPVKHVPYEIGIDNIQWAPKVYDQMPFEKYYELDPNVVLIPYHSFAAANVGHLLWDDFLPIYNLLRIFGYDQTSTTTTTTNTQTETGTQRWSSSDGAGFQHLFLRVNTGPKLFGSCDLRAWKREACLHNIQRFLPLFGVDPNTFSTLTDARLTTEPTVANNNNNDKNNEAKAVPKNYPICAKRAVAGLGWLTDHGVRDHGWMVNHEEHSLDVALARNVGRGPELYAFRNFVLQNLGLAKEEDALLEESSSISPGTKRTSRSDDVSFRILLSAHTSTYPDRSFGLESQHKALVDAFPKTKVTVLELSEMPIVEQISLIANHQPRLSAGGDTKGGLLRHSNKNSGNTHHQHTIFVSACGGGSVSAYFLPRRSSLILYYNETGGKDYFDGNRLTGGQALLDWDLMNNLGYLRVHWLPIGSMEDPEGLDALVALVQHEMDGVLNELSSY